MQSVSLRIHHRLRPGLAMLGALLLCGCSALSPPTPETFDLTAPTRHVAVRSGGRAQIVVAEPSALQAIDSNRILVRPGDGLVTYLPGAQWADRLPRLVQVRLIQTFENAHRIGMVGSPEDKFTPDVSLVTEIRDFQIQTTPSPVAVVTIAARIVNQTTGRIVAAELFTASVPAAGITGRQASAALDQALDKVLVRVMTWTVGKV
jgi:cholesterol transport system auxiliary component